MNPNHAVDLAAFAHYLDGTLDVGNWVWTSDETMMVSSIFKIGFGVLLYVILNWVLRRYDSVDNGTISFGVWMYSLVLVLAIVKGRVESFFTRADSKPTAVGDEK